MYCGRYLILPLGCLCLAGCGVRQYRRVPLQPVSEKQAQVSQQRNGLKICARKLTREDLKTVFDGLILARHSKITCFAVTFQNQRAEPVFLDPKQISVPLVSVKDLIKFIGPHAYADSSFPLIMAAGLAYCTLFTSAIAIGAACEYGLFVYLPIPAIFGFGTAVAGVSGYRSVKGLKQYRKDLEHDMQEKVLHEPLMIAAGGYITTLLFVRNAPEQFTLTLYDKAANNAVSFTLPFAKNNSHRICAIRL